MSREKPQSYPAEFKASAVKMATESDKPVVDIEKDVGINANTLHN
jgi:transposase